jgi:hypothetical protein
MKVLYCTKCKSLVRLTHTHMRSCECGEVRGQYCKDRGHARISQNPATISLVIDTPSFKPAIKRMRQRQKDKPNSTRNDYRRISPLIKAYVRPNIGPGNPRSHPIKAKTH